MWTCVALPWQTASANNAPNMPTSAHLSALQQGAHSLHLEVFINGASTGFIAEFQQKGDGTLTIEETQLQNVGIDPIKDAKGPDGLIVVNLLKGASHKYEEEQQAIYFEIDYDARSTRVISAQSERHSRADAEGLDNSFGALLNYTLVGNTARYRDDRKWTVPHISGLLEGRVYGPLGVFSNSHIVSSSTEKRFEATRLDSTWSYSSPNTLTTYRVGDIITGGLSWTRPVRLGGFQVQRNFGLRPDLVTMPLPELSGSAAVPSTVDVYIDNARRFSQQVPAGPFQITDMPVITGAGSARIVVRDAIGREIVSEVPFFASSKLLSPGLWDYSVEGGFARRFYGIKSQDYDRRFMASGTVRYGMTDHLTLEGHIEGGGGLVNGGIGAVLGFGAYGVGSLAGSVSNYNGQTGYSINAGVELDFGNIRLGARTQRSFGQYSDIASVVSEWSRHPWGHEHQGAAPPRALDQVTVSVPLQFDPTTLNFSYTRFKDLDRERSHILGLSLNRPVGKSTSLYATAFGDVANKKTYGVFVGLSVAFGHDIHASTSVTSNAGGTSLTTELLKAEGAEIGSSGWRIRNTEGAMKQRSASVSYRAPVARLEASVQQHDNHIRATAQTSGAIVAAGGELFLSPPIHDAFAVIDVGAPGVDVQFENRPAGRTNSRGKLLLPSLRAYEPNHVTIDPTNLPIDAVVGATRSVARPADRSGSIVKFDVTTDASAALVSFHDQKGEPLETGSVGQIVGSQTEFTIGYDGQAYIKGLNTHNQAVIEQPTSQTCMAQFQYRPEIGQQVQILGIPCR